MKKNINFNKYLAGVMLANCIGTTTETSASDPLSDLQQSDLLSDLGQSDLLSDLGQSDPLSDLGQQEETVSQQLEILKNADKNWENIRPIIQQLANDYNFKLNKKQHNILKTGGYVENIVLVNDIYTALNKKLKLVQKKIQQKERQQAKNKKEKDDDDKNLSVLQKSSEENQKNYDPKIEAQKREEKSMDSAELVSSTIGTFIEFGTLSNDPRTNQTKLMRQIDNYKSKCFKRLQDNPVGLATLTMPFIERYQSFLAITPKIIYWIIDLNEQMINFLKQTNNTHLIEEILTTGNNVRLTLYLYNGGIILNRNLLSLLKIDEHGYVKILDPAAFRSFSLRPLFKDSLRLIIHKETQTKEGANITIKSINLHKSEVNAIILQLQTPEGRQRLVESVQEDGNKSIIMVRGGVRIIIEDITSADNNNNNKNTENDDDDDNNNTENDNNDEVENNWWALLNEADNN